MTKEFETYKSDLFSEFPVTSTDEWESQILKDLKGEDYEKKLIHQTLDGLRVKPFYRKESRDEIFKVRKNTIAEPIVDKVSEDNSWKIHQDFEVKHPKETNEIVKEAILNGVDSVGFILSGDFEDIDLKSLSEGIKTDGILLKYIFPCFYRERIKSFEGKLKAIMVNPKHIMGCLDVDPLTELVSKGYKENEISAIKSAIKGYFADTKESFPNIKSLNIRGHFYHNSGVTISQEAGISLATAVEYICLLMDEGLTVDEIIPYMQVTLGTGGDYFFEIAKIRAFRLMWNKMMEQFKPAREESYRIFIHSQNSLWNKSIYDAYTNVLRATTEAMSAIIGGTDSLCIEPFDLAFKHPDNHSYRLSRNIQNILKEESALYRVNDAANGSYYIENLTNLIAEKSWGLFQQIEAQGGYLESIKKGYIQQEIKSTGEKRKSLITSGKEKILGTNLYPNFNETMLDKIEIELPEGEEKTGEQSIKADIVLSRKGEIFEKIRLNTEKYVKKGGKRPKVFLFQTGNPGMSTARANFSGNFFAVAGFEIISTDIFPSADAGISEIKDKEYDIVVICSSDEEYKELGPIISKKLKDIKPKIKVVIAGYPINIIEELRNSGINDFIHIRSNMTKVLEKYQREYGIRD